ncbi:hypothetical protein [uncultured Anaerovibrio sp.]|uniref:hypothetical protein n=1 Tax=uncultured Anaerovibrio sp. TaxID=361586 RepID=UPI002605DDED|nr:hypothetical protein [uncultured Anaerovibrio sp.]
MILKMKNINKLTSEHKSPLLYIWIFILVYLMLSETAVLEVLSNYNGYVTFATILVCTLFEVINNYSYSKTEFMFAVFVIVLFFQGVFLGHISIMAEIFFYLFVLRKVNKKQLVRTTLYTIIVVLFFVVVLCACQIIPDTIVLIDGRLRFSLGFLYPSKLQTYLMLVIFLWINAGFSRKNHIKGLVLLNLIVITCFLFTDAKYPFYISLMVSILSVLSILVPCRIKKGELILYLFAMLVPLMPAVLSFIYNPNIRFLVKLNELLTGRLSLSLAAISYRTLFFFNYAPNISVQQGTEGIYGYLDSGYLYVMYNYGIYLFIAVVLLVLIAIYGAMKKKDDQFIIIIVGTIVYSMWYGHVITYLQYSIPILLCTFYIPWKRRVRRFLC